MSSTSVHPTPAVDADETPEKDTLHKGVYAVVSSTWIGEGTTRRKVERKAYFYAEEGEDGFLTIQPLNDKYLPAQPKKRIHRNQFEKKHEPAPEIYLEKTLPALKELNKTLAKADRLRGQGQSFTAEFEFQNALKLDATNIRATFGLGLTFLERGEKQKAAELLKSLCKLEDAFAGENKHLFNEFGIQLRRNKMYDEALGYYARAFKLSPSDENLLYNMARTLYDKEDYKRAAIFLKKALTIRKNFPEALEFLRVLKKQLAKLRKVQDLREQARESAQRQAQAQAASPSGK